MKNTKISKHTTGEVLLREGERTASFYKILAGKVDLYLGYGTENAQRIETLHGGQYFGQAAILCEKPSHCTAVAAQDTALLCLPAGNFTEFVKNNSQNAMAILQAMANSFDALYTALYAHAQEAQTAHTADVPAPQPEAPALSAEKTEALLDTLSTLSEDTLHAELHKEIQLHAAQTLQAEQTLQNKKKQLQNALQEKLQGQTNILPQVYPDFYLEGHQAYPGITHPEYKEFTFKKEFTCPHCKQTFEGLRISYNRLIADPNKSQNMGYDFHMFYKNFETEWYDVVTCPHCYFSSLIDVFLKPGAVYKSLYESNLTQIQDSMHLDFSAERTLDFVFLQHYIALACAPAFSNHRQISACLWMNLYWLYQSVFDQQMMQEAQEKILSSYNDMYVSCDLTPEQQQRTALTLAGIYFEQEKYADAREWAFAVRTNQEGKAIYRNMAETIIDDSRRMLNK